MNMNIKSKNPLNFISTTLLHIHVMLLGCGDGCALYFSFFIVTDFTQNVVHVDFNVQVKYSISLMCHWWYARADDVYFMRDCFARGDDTSILLILVVMTMPQITMITVQ